MKQSVYIKVKDHSVSGETFELLYNSEYDMLETSPQPDLQKLPEYYKSEDYISHTDSKRSLLEKLYQSVRTYTLKNKVKLIDSFNCNGKALLDIGCGTGDFLVKAQKSGWSVKGIEPNSKARSIASDKLNEEVFNVDKLLEFEPKSFDVITLWHVLEHLPNLDEHIKFIESLLKDDGKVVIAVPNYKSYDAKHYKEYWAAYDVPRHLWHFSQKSMALLFSKVEFRIQKTIPMKFDAYYVSLLSEKYKSGWMNFFKAWWYGARSNMFGMFSGEYSSLTYILERKN